MSNHQFQMLGEVRQVLWTLVCWSGASPERLEQFRVRTANADAAFGPGAQDYCYEIYFHGKLLSAAEASIKKALRAPMASQPVRSQVSGIQRDQMNWLTNQLKGREQPLYRQRLGL
jgi:hypothetical protein